MNYDPMTQTKLCQKCGERKPISEFYCHGKGQRSSGPDPYVHRCKTCLSAYYSARYAQDDGTMKARLIAYGRSESGKAKKRVATKRSHNRARLAEYRKRPEVIERHKLSMKRHLAKPEIKERGRIRTAIRRARKNAAGGKFEPADIKRIYQAQKGKCAACHAKLGEQFHIDHITPIVRGGNSFPANLQLLCPPCNYSKNARDPIDFMQSIGRLL
jgi:5-methylcytosine-specific restriction endonuclease McrA